MQRRSRLGFGPRPRCLVPGGPVWPRHVRRHPAHPPLQPACVSDPARGLCPDSVPDGAPGDAELVGGQGRDRDVEMLECIGGPVHGTVGQFRPGPGQRVLLRERRSRTVLVRAAPDTLAHTSRTGRPKHGLSWSRTCRRPCPTATTPQSDNR